MPFTSEEKKELFEKLGEHSVSLGVIKTKLISGEKRFEDLQKTRDDLIRHKQHHKTLNWMAGLGIPIVSAMVGWYVTRGN